METPSVSNTHSKEEKDLQWIMLLTYAYGYAFTA